MWQPLAKAIDDLYSAMANAEQYRDRSSINTRPKNPSTSRVTVSGADANRSLQVHSSASVDGNQRVGTPDIQNYTIGEEVLVRPTNENGSTSAGDAPLARKNCDRATIVSKNNDGTYNVKYKGIAKKKKTAAGHGIASIGIKRLMQIVKQKVEMKARGPAAGKFATVNPHVLKRMFMMFDTSGSGELSRKDFARALREQMGLMNISESDMDALINVYDSDGDGSISYEEFAKQILPTDFSEQKGTMIDFPSSSGMDGQQALDALVKEIKTCLLTKTKSLRETFRRMGGAGDGEVSLSEFVACLRNNNLGVGKERAMKALFKVIDKDKSGQINFEEFSSVLGKTEEKEDGNFFIGGGLSGKSRKRRTQIMSVGRKRLHEMLLDKLEQKAKGAASGKFARTSEHVLKRMFGEFDEDGSGMLDLGEFSSALRFKLGLMNVSDKDIKSLFDFYCQDPQEGLSIETFIEKVMPKDFADGHGTIDFPSAGNGLAGGSIQEKVASLKQRIKDELLTKGKGMRDAFRSMGGSGDGSIDLYEFKTCLRNNHIGIGAEVELRALFREIDKDGSGAITFDEFAACLNKDTTKLENNFFLGGGRDPRKKKTYDVPSIGYKRVLTVMREKIEQKVRGRGSGSFATVNPDVMKSMFASFDDSGDGELTYKEMENALRFKLGMMNISSKDMDELLRKFDKDKDGTITYDEFIAKVLPPEISHGVGGLMDFPSDDPNYDPNMSLKEQVARLKKQITVNLVEKAKNMRTMFRNMGAAGSGQLSCYEFRAALRNYHLGIGIEPAVDALFREIDTDGSGSINFDEFAKYLNSHPEVENDNFFTGGGGLKKVRAVKVPSIGVRRLKEVLKAKIEQKCRKQGSVHGTTSPHVLARIFREFDTSGDGSLNREEFEKALRQKLGLTNVSDRDIQGLIDEFDADGDAEITYKEFVAKMFPKDFSNGGGGIIDFPCDDPASQGTTTQRLQKLRNEIKKKLLTNSKNLRVAFRKMGGAGDGKVDKYEFMACLRNHNLGCGQEALVGKLFTILDADGSGSLTFSEFADGISKQLKESGEEVSKNVPIERLRPSSARLLREAALLNSGNPQDSPEVQRRYARPNEEVAAERHMWKKENSLRPAVPAAANNILRATNMQREAVRPSSGRNRKFSRKRPASGGRRVRATVQDPSATVAAPGRMMRTVNNSTGKLYQNHHRSAPTYRNRARRSFASAARGRATMVKELKRRYLSGGRNAGISVRKSPIRAHHTQKPQVDLSSVLDIKAI
eukprot:g4985.t1